MVRVAKSYRINLVRNLREKERKDERRRRFQAMAGFACFVILTLAILYSVFTILRMEGVLEEEAKKLAQVENEFKKYTAARMIVEKADVELLYKLQGRGIFWTKKLAALASHLPDNYAITGFSYRNGELNVSGTGFLSHKQDQLLILDGYMNRLRSDSTFSDVFKHVYLNNASRKDELGSGKVSFEFTAVTAEGMKKK